MKQKLIAFFFRFKYFLTSFSSCSKAMSTGSTKRGQVISTLDFQLENGSAYIGLVRLLQRLYFVDLVARKRAADNQLSTAL